MVTKTLRFECSCDLILYTEKCSSLLRVTQLKVGFEFREPASLYTNYHALLWLL